jgi:hypothetical protein
MDPKRRPGRGARESTDYEHAPFVNRLLDTVLRHPEFHVTGPQSGYRNRMTYALRNEGQAFGVHPLAVPEVNALAEWMHRWVQEESDVAALAPLTYDEMTVKVTRRQRLMLTLSISLPEDEALRHRWSESEIPLLAAQLRAAFPALDSAAYWLPERHAAPKGTSAVGFRAPPGPFGEYPYTVFIGEPKLVEEIPAPDGPLPYYVSHGTFSEINHYMEARIVPTIMDFCRRPLGACGSQAGELDGDVELLVTGRDTNAVSLGLGRTRGPWHAIHAVSHCHLVADDCAHNQREFYPDFVRYRAQQCDKGATHELIAKLQAERPLVAVLSSGRHGLRPAIIEALRAKPNVVRVVYDSCNPASLRRDMARFMAGNSGFVLENFRSFDFFASTPYMVSISSFVRRRRSLIIPVGPCGVGKSTFAAALQTGSGPAACGLAVFDRDQTFAQHRGGVPKQPCDAAAAAAAAAAGGGGGVTQEDVRVQSVAGEASATGLEVGDRACRPRSASDSETQCSETDVHAAIENVWDSCGRCGSTGQARRLATLMHAIAAAHPGAAAAIGKPSSKWFKQRPSAFVLKPVKGGQQLVSRAAEVVEWDEQQQQQQQQRWKQQKVEATDSAVSRAKHCKLLGVEQDASADTIRKRFHTLARTVHPDKGGDELEFAAIQSSYERLLGFHTVTPSLRETLQATHADLVRFLSPTARKEWTLGAQVEANDANCVVPDGATLLLDSTNGGRDGRDHARRVSTAARTFVVQLRPQQQQQQQQQQIEQWLHARAANRPSHPAFPPDDAPAKQLQKIRDVLKGIAWVDSEERGKISAGGGDVIDCDPADEVALSELPYRVWSRVFVDNAVRCKVGL